MNEKMRGAMKAARKISTTLDIWTSDKCSKSYLGVTVHFVNPKTRKRNNFRVCCREFDSPHTGTNIAKMLKNIFIDFDIQDKVFRTLTDNASNMIKGILDHKDFPEDNSRERILESEEDDSDSGDDEDSNSDDSDSEPEDPDDDTEVQDVERLANNLEDSSNSDSTSFSARKIERLRCIAHSVQLVILKTIRQKKVPLGGFFEKSEELSRSTVGR